MMDPYGITPQQRMAMALARTAAAKGADTSATSSPWEGANRGANAMLAAYLMNGMGRAPGNPDMMARKDGALGGMFGGQPPPNPLASMGGETMPPTMPDYGKITSPGMDQPGWLESMWRRFQ